MKEIKAYARPAGLGAAISRLKQEGACDVTISRVEAFGTLAKTEDDCLRPVRSYPIECSGVAKVDVVCADGDVNRIVQVLKELVSNGGGGRHCVFVSNIDPAVTLGVGNELAEAIGPNCARDRLSAGV